MVLDSMVGRTGVCTMQMVMQKKCEGEKGADRIFNALFWISCLKSHANLHRFWKQSIQIYVNFSNNWCREKKYFPKIVLLRLLKKMIKICVGLGTHLMPIYVGLSNSWHRFFFQVALCRLFRPIVINILRLF